MALWVMSDPHVGPTFSIDTDEAGLWARLASTPATLVASVAETPDEPFASLASTSRLAFEPLPSWVMVAPPRPSGVRALWAWATVTPGAGTSQEVPPTNSML